MQYVWHVQYAIIAMWLLHWNVQAVVKSVCSSHTAADPGFCALPPLYSCLRAAWETHSRLLCYWSKKKKHTFEEPLYSVVARCPYKNVIHSCPRPVSPQGAFSFRFVALSEAALWTPFQTNWSGVSCPAATLLMWQAGTLIAAGLCAAAGITVNH